MFAASRTVVAALLLLTPLAAQLPRSPDALPPDVRRVLEQRMGGDPFAALKAWQRAPDDAEAPEWLPDFRTQDDAWHWLWHTALWHADADIAYAGARLLSYPGLDLPASRRWLEVVWPHVFAEKLAIDWGEIRRQVSADDVARLLEDRDCWRAEVRPFFLGDMHRCMRPDHAPLLAKLAQSDDPFLRRGGFGNLGTIASLSDQHRELIGHAFLAWQVADLRDAEAPFERSRNARHVPRAYQLPVSRPGWSPLLRAVLERDFLELDKSLFGTYWVRWAEDETPGPEDRLLLAALLECGKAEGCWLALRTMARMPPDPYLQRRLDTPPAHAPAGLLLAARHEWDELRELAATERDALAVALEFDFDATFLAWCAQAFGSDAAAGLEAIESLIAVADVLESPYQPQPQLMARLRQAIERYGERLDFARLDRLVDALPAARSPQLVEWYWASITPQNLAQSAVEVFEVSPQIDLTERLYEWGRSDDAAVQAPALEVLLQLGDVTLDDAVLAHWQASHADDPLLLARCRASSTIDEHLRAALRRLEAEREGGPSRLACRTLAAVAAYALPAELGATWADSLFERRQTPHVEQRFGAWCTMVLEGDAVGALLDDVAATPLRELHVRNFGLVDDDRVRDLLQRVRSTPGAQVQDAIGQLALAGDWRCKQEIDDLRHLGVYGWFDDADHLVQAGGRTLDLVPWLLDELETNCCRRNSAASALEFLTGFETHDQPERALCTQPERARRFWSAVGEHLRWSELANRFVVAAH